MLLELQTKSKVIGVKQSAKAVRADQARCVYLAEDADPALLAPIEDQCCEKEIPLIRVESPGLAWAGLRHRRGRCGSRCFEGRLRRLIFYLCFWFLSEYYPIFC